MDGHIYPPEERSLSATFYRCVQCVEEVACRVPDFKHEAFDEAHFSVCIFRGDFHGSAPVSYTHLDVYKRQFGSRVVGECLAQLLDNPGAGRAICRVAMKDTPPIMGNDEEAVQNVEVQRRYDKEVHLSLIHI